MKSLFRLLQVWAISLVGFITTQAQSLDGFKFIAPRSNMLGQGVSNVQERDGITTFRLLPQTLDKFIWVDSIVQVGPDSANIKQRLGKYLTLPFVRSRRNYELRIIPTDIRIVYLGPKTLTSQQQAVNNYTFVTGVIIARSIKATLVQTGTAQVNYKWVLDEAVKAITAQQPMLAAALSRIQIDTAKSGNGHNVVARWAAIDKNLTYGIATMRVKNTRGVSVYAKPFEANSNANKTYSLILNQDECTHPAAPEYGSLLTRDTGKLYKLCYSQLKPDADPELIVRYDPSDDADKPVVVIPVKKGRNGPVWYGNYLLGREILKNGRGALLTYLHVSGLLDPQDQKKQTILIKQGYITDAKNNGDWDTCISYSVYEFYAL